MSPAQKKSKPRRFVIRIGFAAAFLLALVSLEACYYAQAIRGHTELMGKRRDVAEVIADDTTSAELKRKLELVQQARDFSIDELLLPDNDSYRSYSDLERDYVVWNVFAAPEFSLEPKTWCYPVAGCVAYRGYFREEAAAKEAQELTDDGFDVAMGGVAAYSTLGRFADPVLNTMMRWPDVDLIVTLFHELAHQKLYVKGDSGFNESYASAVAEIGIARWLASRGESEQLDDYNDRRALRRELTEITGKTRDVLSRIYASDLGEANMRERKRRVLEELSETIRAHLKRSDVPTSGWLAGSLNNARLASIDVYDGHVAAFRQLLAECDEQIECFHARAVELAELSGQERQQRLKQLGTSR